MVKKPISDSPFLTLIGEDGDRSRVPQIESRRDRSGGIREMECVAFDFSSHSFTKFGNISLTILLNQMGDRETPSYASL